MAEGNFGWWMKGEVRGWAANFEFLILDAELKRAIGSEGTPWFRIQNLTFKIQHCASLTPRGEERGDAVNLEF